MTCWKLTSRISLGLKCAPTLDIPHLWGVSFRLVGSWRTGLPVACSARLCLECCAVWIPSFYELCPLLPRQGQTSGSELRGKERQSDRSKKRSQMSLKQQTAAPGWLVFTPWFWIHRDREKTLSSPRHPCQVRLLLLLLLSHFSRVRLWATPSLGFSRQDHWSGLPFPSPVYKSEKWKWSHSVMSDSSRPCGLQPTRLLHPWDFPGKSTGVGCHCLLRRLGFTLLNVCLALQCGFIAAWAPQGEETIPLWFKSHQELAFTP